MRISVNGKEHQTADNTTVQQLLEQLGLKGPLAVELNQRICTKKDHPTTTLNPSDVASKTTTRAKAIGTTNRRPLQTFPKFKARM